MGGSCPLVSWFFMTYGNSGGNEYGTISNGSNSPLSILQTAYNINNQ